MAGVAGPFGPWNPFTETPVAVGWNDAFVTVRGYSLSITGSSYFATNVATTLLTTGRILQFTTYTILDSAFSEFYPLDVPGMKNGHIVYSQLEWLLDLRNDATATVVVTDSNGHSSYDLSVAVIVTKGTPQHPGVLNWSYQYLHVDQGTQNLITGEWTDTNPANFRLTFNQKGFLSADPLNNTPLLPQTP